MQRLRKRAERYLKRDATRLADPDHDVLRLNHELQVHQVALEWQNEALRCAKDELEATQNERLRFDRALNHDLAEPIFALGLRLKSLEDCSSPSERAKIQTRIASSAEVLKALSKSLAGLAHGRGTRKSLLQRYITHLVSNAVKYTERSGVTLGFVVSIPPGSESGFGIRAPALRRAP